MGQSAVTHWHLHLPHWTLSSEQPTHTHSHPCRSFQVGQPVHSDAYNELRPLNSTPEVERARRLIAETCTGYVIDAVDTVVDTIVFDGADNDEFANEIRGRTVTGCERKGKQ